MRREDRDRILGEVQAHVVAEVGAQGASPEDVLAESVYQERLRLRDERGGRAREDAAFWDSIQAQLGRAAERELQAMLRAVVARYAEEIVGNFDERVYRVTTRAVPPALGLLLNAVSPRRMLSDLPHGAPRLHDAVILQGELEHLRRLHEAGTVILAPTHVSNMDSIVAGYAIFRMGLPPFVYGAGLNLFANPLLGFFMHNLGAYTVDRKKTDPLYRRVLKTYATSTLSHGYDSLFFPGGARSRSGAVERHLKLGLLGCGLGAYIDNLRAGAARPRVFVVPATLSYQLVLEAETLIDDFLKEVGKSRYVITDDEFSRPARVGEFLSRLFSLDSKIFVTVSRGLDPFGNPVDDEGNSLDPRGRVVDSARYVFVDGEPRPLAQRDAEYTRELGERIADAFARDNVIQSTHVTARAAFSLLRRASPGVGLIRLIRLGARSGDLELRAVHREADRLLKELRGLAADGRLRLAPTVAAGEAEDVVSDGLRHFATYHRTPALTRRGDRLVATERQLLFYYQNRLEGYRLDRALGTAPALSADHRSLGVAA